MDNSIFKVAICEDELVQQKNLTRLLEKWAAKKEYQLEIVIYDKGEALWFAWIEKMDVDLFLLDIDLGQDRESGMELARKIRQKDERVAIVFITGMVEYMSEGYDVQALHFLVKPVKEERFEQVLELAVRLAPKKEESLLLTQEGEAELIPIKTILYVEAFSHSVTLHLAENGVQWSKDVNLGLKEMEAQLLEKSFFRCHRSYLVNLAHVKKIAKNELLLDVGIRVPVSRMKEKGTYLAFLEYHKKKEGGKVWA